MVAPLWKVQPSCMLPLWWCPSLQPLDLDCLEELRLGQLQMFLSLTAWTLGCLSCLHVSLSGLRLLSWLV